MTVLNYKIDRGHPMLNDGPFITLAEVIMARLRSVPNTNQGLVASFPSLKLI